MSVSTTDFGEKIGGAKKDLWRMRGLMASDLVEMNDREATKYVTKDNVWRKPDYDAMIEDGVPAEVAYYIKTVRDSLAVSPVYAKGDTPDRIKAVQKEYIDTISWIRDCVETVKSKDDVFAAFERCLVAGGYCERTPSGRYQIRRSDGNVNRVLTDKLLTTMRFWSDQDYTYRITRQAEKKQFGVSKDNKVPTGYEIRYNDGKHSWSSNNDWKPDTFYVVKGHAILRTNLESRETALDWVRGLVKQRGGSGKNRFVPVQLEKIVRDGSDYRSGKDVTGEDYLHTFGFKGGEFGNWMTQNDRQASLNYGFDALKDLASVLEVDDKDVAYGGVLSIAFGARGNGKFAAHYEPLLKVINLTKLRGAGSLAHEWWHAVDDYLGSKFGVSGYLTNNARAYPLFAKLLNTMKYKKQTQEQAVAGEETDYYRNSKEMDEIYHKDGGYWESDVEMSARAFATYVMDKLGYRSDYLVGHAESAVGTKVESDNTVTTIRAYPEGGERIMINMVFDEIFDDLKKREIFHSCGRPPIPYCCEKALA